MISEGYKKGFAFKRKALGDEIDKGKYSKETNPKAFEYFSRPPYQYTKAEPKSWGKKS